MSSARAQRVARQLLLCCALVATSCTWHHAETTPLQSHDARGDESRSVLLHTSSTPPHSASASPSSTEERPPLPSSYSCPDILVAARKGGSAPDRYVLPTPAERASMAQLFAKLNQADPELLLADAAALGFVLAPVSEQPGVWALVEAAGKKRGGGAYLVRARASSGLVVQAPHTFFDEGTLPLACELFERSRARALFIETAHRYKAAEASDAGTFPADLAHAKDSLFQAATAGVLSAGEPRTLVQLHGFGPRESGSNVVLSNGTTAPSTLVNDAQQALGAVIDEVQRYPQETRELGATTNVQGELARSHGGRFLHVEISAPLRARLLQDSSLRAHFLDALVRGLGNQ